MVDPVKKLKLNMTKKNNQQTNPYPSFCDIKCLLPKHLNFITSTITYHNDMATDMCLLRYKDNNSIDEKKKISKKSNLLSYNLNKEKKKRYHLNETSNHYIVKLLT